MDLLTRIVVGLNAAAGALAWVLLAPLSVLPGWLSATLVAAASGVLLLIIFKYTSNQRAMRQVSNDVKAHLLALKLFKDSAPVTLRALGGVLAGAVRRMILSVLPMVVMAVPVGLLLGQIGLWYQYRPLRVGEEAVVTLKLNGPAESSWPEATLAPTEAVEVVLGPVRVLSKREICWQVQARQAGLHRVVFLVDGRPIEKELAVGDAFMRVSVQRPAWRWDDALLHPWEPPFRPDSPVWSIAIDYPERSSWICGTDWWVVYWFAVSMVAAFCFRPWFRVHL